MSNSKCLTQSVLPNLPIYGQISNNAIKIARGQKPTFFPIEQEKGFQFCLAILI